MGFRVGCLLSALALAGCTDIGVPTQSRGFSTPLYMLHPPQAFSEIASDAARLEALTESLVRRAALRQETKLAFAAAFGRANPAAPDMLAADLAEAEARAAALAELLPLYVRAQARAVETLEMQEAAGLIAPAEHAAARARLADERARVAASLGAASLNARALGAAPLADGLARMVAGLPPLAV
ncbi:MAG: hypothetical protein AAFZ02_10785 [Pseudomonadota bacterium]